MNKKNIDKMKDLQIQLKKSRPFVKNIRDISIVMYCIITTLNILYWSFIGIV